MTELYELYYKLLFKLSYSLDLTPRSGRPQKDVPGAEYDSNEEVSAEIEICTQIVL